MSNWENYNCLVTGGAGFIGSHITETLALKGSKVTVLDDLSGGKSDNLKPLQNMGIKFVHGSILDSEHVNVAFEDIDYVFHQAALISVPESIKNPSSYNKVNVKGTLNILEKSRKHDVKKVIFASTAAVYGNNSVSPKNESMDPSPQNPYAKTKLSCENDCLNYNSIYDLPTTSLRYFNVYGPKQDPTSQYASVIPAFISLLNDGRAPVVHGDGDQTRDFVYVSDVVQANLKAALSDKADGKILNIATGEHTTLNTLVSLIIKQMGVDINPKYTASRIGDIRHSLADISMAKKLIDYYPKYSISQGLVETVSLFNNPP